MAEHKFRRSSVAVLGVIALGASALLGTSAATAVEDYNYGDIKMDPLDGTSLTVHKYEDQDPSGLPDGPVGHPDGSVTNGTFEKPLAGVVFTAYQLVDEEDDPIELLTYAGWAGDSKTGRISLNELATQVAGSNACEVPAGSGYKLGPALDMPATGTDGSSEIKNLPVGAYIVCETYAPSTVTKRSNPFLVTIPLPVQDGTTAADDKGWLYKVHVYPKNTVGKFEKTIDPQGGLGLGSEVNFTITGAIPDISPDIWTEFTVTDALDKRLDPRRAANGDLNAVTILAPTPAPKHVIEYDDQDHKLIVRFTDPDWLKANAGTEFKIQVHTTLNATGVDGIIENDAQQWVNNPNFAEDGNPPGTTDKVRTNWGTATLKKVDSAEDGNNATLGGAEFEVWAAETPYAASADECSIETTGSEPIKFTTGVPPTTTTTTKVVSDENGIVNVPALYVSDSKNAPVDAPFRCYVLIETQAPAGYVTPTGDAAKRAMAINIGANDFTTDPIKNSRQVIPGLPLTGAQGQVLLITGGVAAAAIVLGLVLVNRRRQNAAL